MRVHPVAVIIAALIATPAFADASAKDALTLYASGEVAGRAFLQGMTQGLSWANSAMRTGAKLYCPPNDPIGLERHVVILKGFLAAHPELWNEPVGLSLLLSLQTAYPCKSP